MGVRDWRGIVYPKELPQRRWFEFYATLFDTVEINNTFYRLPPPATMEQWAAQAALAPLGFVYAVKLGQFGSHRMKLRDAASWLPNHLDRAERLGRCARADARATAAAMEAQRRATRRVLSVAPSRCGGRSSCGSRAGSTTTCSRCSGGIGAALCIHDMLPNHPWVLTTDWTYVRFHGPEARCASTRAATAAAACGAPPERMRAWLDRGFDVYAYFNNDWYGHAVEDATWLKHRLQADRRVTVLESQVCLIRSDTMTNCTPPSQG